jgi:hypothetical protein
VVAQLAAQCGFDFVNGDTMGEMPVTFWNASVASGRPLALQPEGGSGLDALAFNKIGCACTLGSVAVGSGGGGGLVALLVAHLHRSAALAKAHHSPLSPHHTHLLPLLA